MAHSLRFVSFTQSSVYKGAFEGETSNGGVPGSGASGGGLQVCSRALCFSVTFRAVNVLCFMPSTVKVTGYRLASSAMTLFLGIAKVSLSAVNKPGLSNYLDLVAIIVALRCILEMPEGRYSYTDTTF